MFHYFNAVQLKTGLAGYYCRAIDPTTGGVVTMAADTSGTPILTTSDVANMCRADAAGNFDFYVDPGTYHQDIYGPDATTFIVRIPDVPMGDPFGTVSVKDPQFAGGAKGDGTTDDTAALQAAFNTGKNVDLPEGTYLFSTLILASAGATITGRSPGAILRQTSAAANGIQVRAADITIQNLRLEGAATASAVVDTGKFGVYTETAYPAPRLTLLNVTFSGATTGVGFDNAVKIEEGSDYAKVLFCTFEQLWGTVSGTGYGVLCGGVTGLIVEGCTGIGTANRGRHMIYLSAGTSYCRCSDNYASGFNFEAFAQNVSDSQPANRGNIVAHNVAISCGSAALSGSSISAFGNVQDTIVCNNVIINSPGCGIKFDGTASTKFKRNHAHSNLIVDAAYAGIDVLALQGGSITSNDVQGSSQTSLGLYWNIRLKSDGTTGCSNILISGNRAGGAQARSSLYLDNTAPAPTNLKIDGNKFDVCNLADIELNSLPIAIDGYLRASTTWDIGNLTDGASELKTGISVPGAVVGDRVIVGHTSLVAAGWRLNGTVTAADTVGVIVENKTGGTLNPASGTLYLDVFKR